VELSIRLGIRGLRRKNNFAENKRHRPFFSGEEKQTQNRKDFLIIGMAKPGSRYKRACKVAVGNLQFAVVGRMEDQDWGGRKIRLGRGTSGGSWNPGGIYVAKEESEVRTFCKGLLINLSKKFRVGDPLCGGFGEREKVVSSGEFSF